MINRWQRHEISFVTLVSCFFLIYFYLNGLFLEEGTESFIPFSPSAKYDFDLVQLPLLAPLFILFAAYLVINLLVVPKFYNKRSYTLTIVCMVILWAILATSFYAGHYTQSLVKEHEVPGRRARSVNYGVWVSGTILFTYSLYAILREQLIKWMNANETRRDFRNLVSNKITATIFYFTGFFIFSVLFGIIRSDTGGLLAVCIVLPSFLIVFFNTYFVFPTVLKHPRIREPKLLLKLLIAPLFFIILFSTLYYSLINTNRTLPVIAMFLFFILITTPISWLYYESQKEKLAAVLRTSLDLSKTRADLNFLRSQVNPHFLFNALNTIYGTALQENALRTAEAAQRLGDMMRFMLHENSEDQIPLPRELEYLENYIALQSLRTKTSENITIEFVVDPPGKSYNIAPMLLIPFIENAFKHGISLQDKSWIRSSVNVQDGVLHFNISNSIHKRTNTDTERDHHGIGLENVKQRLELLYPAKHKLIIHQTGSEFFIHLTININQ